MHWVQIITNEAVPYTYRNLYDMNKFLCIYQSPYYLSVDNAFSVLHIQNVYIYTVFQRNKTLSHNKQLRCGGVIVRVLVSCVIDRGFYPRSG